MPINIPVKQNEKLEALLERVQRDEELNQLWRCANVNAVNRLHMSDHGYVHVKIVANLSLKLLRLLVDAGIDPGIVTDHALRREDAEVVVVLASLLHDVGLSVHWDHHEVYSVFIANERLPGLLAGLYEKDELVVVQSEILHAIVAHGGSTRCLTLEAGIVKVANALDMSQGRSRIPFEAGSVNIHSVSAQAIDKVDLKKGDAKPVNIEVHMNNSAGIYQLDHLLKHKLEASGLAPHIEVTARVEGETDKRLIHLYNFNAE
ncbi:MAG: HD domain-containing protein [Candidatus Sericytochromatia bacterium]|nr:HD domain-containing protein [Candidatus Tanganyikabacteria bacterium]